MRVIKAIYSDRVVYYYETDGRIWFIRKWNDLKIDSFCTAFTSLNSVWADRKPEADSIHYVSSQDEDFCVTLLQSKVK